MTVCLATKSWQEWIFNSEELNDPTISGPNADPDAEQWNKTDLEVLPATNNNDGTQTRKFRSPDPVGSSAKEFIRLKFSN